MDAFKLATNPPCRTGKIEESKPYNTNNSSLIFNESVIYVIISAIHRIFVFCVFWFYLLLLHIISFLCTLCALCVESFWFSFLCVPDFRFLRILILSFAFTHYFLSLCSLCPLCWKFLIIAFYLFLDGYGVFRNT